MSRATLLHQLVSPAASTQYRPLYTRSSTGSTAWLNGIVSTRFSSPVPLMTRVEVMSFSAAVTSRKVHSRHCPSLLVSVMFVVASSHSTRSLMVMPTCGLTRGLSSYSASE